MRAGADTGFCSLGVRDFSEQNFSVYVTDFYIITVSPKAKCFVDYKILCIALTDRVRAGHTSSHISFTPKNPCKNYLKKNTIFYC